MTIDEVKELLKSKGCLYKEGRCWAAVDSGVDEKKYTWFQVGNIAPDTTAKELKQADISKFDKNDDQILGSEYWIELFSPYVFNLSKNSISTYTFIPHTPNKVNLLNINLHWKL